MILRHPTPAVAGGPPIDSAQAPPMTERKSQKTLWERFEDFLMKFTVPAREKSDAVAWHMAS